MRAASLELSNWAMPERESRSRMQPSGVLPLETPGIDLLFVCLIFTSV